LFTADSGPVDPPADAAEPPRDGGGTVDAARGDGGAEACADGCLVDGVCHREGAANPANPCEACMPWVSRTAFAPNDGARCDDGAYCTVGDTCRDRVCVGGFPRACDDGVACTVDDRCDEGSDACVSGFGACGAGETCDAVSGSCSSTCAGCAIDGVCIPDGTPNPVNGCERCDVSTSAHAWSPADGVVCDDGAYCTERDTCRAGACVGTARSCDDGIGCNGAETCDETVDSCAVGSSTCGALMVCDATSDRCMPSCLGCLIGGVCHADGTQNPMNPCEVCDSRRSMEIWSANDGATCDDGEFCTLADVCAAGRCGGAPRTCDDGVACTGGDFCDEGADVCVPGRSTCAGDEMCSNATGACGPVLGCTGCLIGGICITDGARNPLAQCEVCDVTATTTGWSPANGHACEDGDYCTVGDACSVGVCVGGGPRACTDGVACNGEEVCDEDSNACVEGVVACAPAESCDVEADICVPCPGCVIDGSCYLPGVSRPGDPCQVCDPHASESAWTAGSGASCDDGSSCTQSDTCVAGTCTGTPLACDDGVACNGAETCDPAIGECVPGVATCEADEWCDTIEDECAPTCAGCTIDGDCYVLGARNPANHCEVCADPGDTAWTPADGALCDDGALCTIDDRCLAGVCAGVALECDDSVVCNGVETCDASLGVCVSSGTTCALDTVCDPSVDMCVAPCDGCLILGVCFALADTHPSNPCLVCGNVGDTTWSHNDAVSCDDGSLCTVADRCFAGACIGEPLPCSDDIACNGLETCSETTGECVEGASPCTDGATCDPEADMCVPPPG
jgi:hypothetical protein